MGLGKTVEALALVLANPSTNPACKTTLIVAPVALMRQWEKEVHRHVHPRHRLSVYVYHGTSKKADFDRLRTYDVVLTTFGTLAQEMKVKQKRMLAEAEQRQQRAPQIKRTDREILTLLGRKSMWYRVILDEAQCIKNRNTLTSKAADDLQARHRLCMTGTPMMNSIDELFALIRFLKISPYNVWGKFSFEISKPLKTKSTVLHKRAMGRVQAVLKSIMLRRGKTTVVDGKQICEIPPKHIHMQKVDFSEDERALYQAVETQNQLTFNRYLQRGTVNNNYANVLVMLLRLRQICDHPRLVKDLSVQVSTEGIDENVLMERARLLADDVVQRLSDTDSFECPICYETDANSTIIIPCGHTTCGECFQKLVDPSQAVREGNENSSAKCPHCRGALSSDMITDFKHFCKVRLTMAKAKLYV
jgi:SNF2 family DNA or RNA helicase